jgi:hypothetical protein
MFWKKPKIGEKVYIIQSINDCISVYEVERIEKRSFWNTRILFHFVLGIDNLIGYELSIFSSYKCAKCDNHLGIAVIGTDFNKVIRKAKKLKLID